jgi:hypothetical protein
MRFGRCGAVEEESSQPQLLLGQPARVVRAVVAPLRGTNKRKRGEEGSAHCVGCWKNVKRRGLFVARGEPR